MSSGKQPVSQATWIVSLARNELPVQSRQRQEQEQEGEEEEERREGKKKGEA